MIGFEAGPKRTNLIVESIFLEIYKLPGTKIRGKKPFFEPWTASSVDKIGLHCETTQVLLWTRGGILVHEKLISQFMFHAPIIRRRKIMVKFTEENVFH
jgi:hypothetical protein